ncbi:MAG TPA: RNA methyltransferase [Ohtaekwangia sp.]|nr:RNA methyltransferase [Ohtaekwangia sp.]
MHPLITSPQNPKIKNIRLLEKARERSQQGLLVIEGLKELTLALAGGYTLQTVFFCPEIISSDALQELDVADDVLVPVQKNVFEKIAYRESTGGIIALARHMTHTLHDLHLSDNPLVLVLEAVEKPGNLGAILRTADAAGIDAVVICDPQTDFYNPNVIRSSVGTIFTIPVASATSAETMRWLKDHRIKIFCTYLQASRPYHLLDFRGPTAIIMGTESTGLSEYWIGNSDENIIIPMQGKIDSMNVSTAAAVVVFEARRQRGF